MGEEVKGVGVMKDEELKLEEIESSHTLGGYRRCRCYSAVRYTMSIGLAESSAARAKDCFFVYY